MATILMISAQPAAQARALERLRARGHVLTFARDAGGAARLLRKRRFDLVLLDGHPARGKRNPRSEPAGSGARIFTLLPGGAARRSVGEGAGPWKPASPRVPLVGQIEKAIALAEARGSSGALRQRLREREKELDTLRSHVRAERMRLSLILSSLVVGVVLTNRVGKVSLVNESARRMLGLPDSGPLGPLRPGSPLRRLLQRMRDPRLHGVKTGRLALQKENNAELRTLVAPLRDRSESFWGSLAILEETGEKSRLNDLKSDFISRVSHELKTPLASIRAASDVIAQAKIGALNRKQEKMLRIITEETGNLVCLVEDLLDISEIESGRIELKFGRCSLSEAARASLDQFRARYQEKGVTLLDAVLPSCPPIQADPKRISQVFHHLLSNALKFTPAGGRVELKVAVEDQEGDDGVRTMLVASVSDSGIGIARKDLERIFDKFHQTENLNTRSAGGSGLGLSISKFLVEAHGGELWVDSHPGAGSTFFFTIPTTR
ncbi:MAG TPA: ATP-binding protein [Candidatus Polarisedimenticolia bacterium]|nr:ATP-binding protein [Candidatus Polarisedimenticolia bacterium]